MRPFFLILTLLNIVPILNPSCMRFSLLFCLGALIISCSDNQETRFTRIDPSESGITFVNEIIEKDTFNILHNEYMYNGGGVGVGDLNNDGLQDLVFTGNKISSRIYLNLGNFKFQDITERFKELNAKQWISGVVIVDINSDGFRDVYLTSTMNDDPEMRKNQLWLNEGLDSENKPSFREAAAEFGIDDRGHSMHASFFDYDLDGDLDLYVLNNVISKEVPTNYRPKLTDGSSPNNDHFYENLGNGEFQDITIKAGITIEGYGLGIAVADFNKDFYPDLYISNDYISNDILYLNQRNGTFKNASETYLSQQSRFSMGNDAADVNNDGFPEIITMDMMPEDYFRKKQTINGNSYYVYFNNQKYGYQNQYIRNMFQVHNGFIDTVMLPFSEQGQMAGVYQTEWSWSPLFADYDNDGDKDLLVTNGFPMDLTDKDFTNYKAEYFGSLISEKELLARIPVVKVSNYAFENKGELKFQNVTESWGLKIPSFSNGASFVDLDNDGDLDYVANNIDDPAFLYKNNTNKVDQESSWIRVNVRGEGQNPEAIGAVVELWAGGSYQISEKFLSRGYISSIEPILHFGLGQAKQVDSIRITWPGFSKKMTIENPAIRQVLQVSSTDVPETNLVRYRNHNLPWLSNQNDLIELKDQETDYVDFFQGQAVMQHKFSMIGPVIKASDLDGDGIEELFMAAGFGYPTSIYKLKNGKYEPVTIPGLSGERDTQISGILIADLDKDGDQDVVEVAGGYSQEDPMKYKQAIYRNEKNKFTREELDIPPFIGSVVKAQDFDRDGDLDLFIGQRVERKNFPYSGNSWLMVNQGNRFEGKPLSLEMVTDAEWMDYDSDGWMDLIVTRELNTVIWLRNDSGKTLIQSEISSIKNLHGFWESVSVLDLDGNGSQDLILGNLGENHRFTISDQFPFSVYGIDVDKNGVVDPICTSFWKDQNGLMQEYPVNYMDELFAQSPFFRKLFTSYTTFSYTNMNGIYQTDTINRNRVRFANTTQSMVLWNEKTKWIAEVLPGELQNTPLTQSLIYDFNQDGKNEILLCGNDHSYDVSTGNYDAGRGIILGFGQDRKLKVYKPAETGLSIMGQVNSLALISKPEPIILVGINRKPLQLYRFNLGSR